MKKILLLTLVGWAPAVIAMEGLPDPKPRSINSGDIATAQKEYLELHLRKALDSNTLTFQLINDQLQHARIKYRSDDGPKEFCKEHKDAIFRNVADLIALDDEAFDELGRPLGNLESAFAGLFFIAHYSGSEDMKKEAIEQADQLGNARANNMTAIKEAAQKKDASEEEIKEAFRLNAIFWEITADKAELKEERDYLNQKLEIMRVNEAVVTDLMATFKAGKLTVDYLKQVGEAQAARNGNPIDEDSLFGITSVKDVISEFTPGQCNALCSTVNEKAITDHAAEFKKYASIAQLENALLALRLVADCHIRNGEIDRGKEVLALIKPLTTTKNIGTKKTLEEYIKTAKQSNSLHDKRTGLSLLNTLLFCNPDLMEEKWSKHRSELKKQVHVLQGQEHAKEQTQAQDRTQNRSRVGKVVFVLAIGAALVGAAALLYNFVIKKQPRKATA